MKKIVLTLLSFLAIQISAIAANTIEVKTVSVPQSGSAQLEVSLSNDCKFKSFQFNMMLPNGISVVEVVNSDRLPEQMFVQDSLNSISSIGSNYTIVAFPFDNQQVSGNSGILLNVVISASDAIPVDSKLTGIIYDMVLSTVDDTRVEVESCTFDIVVTAPADPWVTLDENSTTLPEASDGETEIKVKRTLKANQWNTICFPFAMTEAQVYEAFGEDVQVAEFIEYESTDDLTSINVIFDEALLAEDGLMANYPYIIKTSKNITEFMVTSVIEPDEENAVAEFTNGRAGSRKEVYGTFYGTLKAGGKVPANCLFLNGGDFWYSTGQSNIKAFRGYFEFVDVLASLETAESNVKLVFRGETTGIKDVTVETANDDMYDLQGRRIVNPDKGVYIKNGKKVVIK
ncbi:MAG: hypothetical protein IKK81_02565 [Prevotella sp.]|nr:hypothetical protein [Prevotella sp.]